VSRSRADLLAMLGIAAAAVVIAWPLLANLHSVPPDDDDLGLDAFVHCGFAGAARQTALRFGQFPLRSPWHGGGYPIYANPDDLTLTPTMLLVLAVGPWAAIKIDFVLTMIVGGVGMFLLTRRKMGYSLVAALFSATAFAFGGFLMARWLRGWRSSTHAVWLPFIMYALWQARCWRTATPAVPNSADSPLLRLPFGPELTAEGRRQHQQANPCEGQRRWWLAVAAGLVAWLFIDHKYVPIIMGWFLLLVGLLRLDEPEKGSGAFCAKHPPPLPRPAWGYFGRLTIVWVFGAGLAAVKLVPMLPLVWAHVSGAPDRPPAWQTWYALGVWLPILAALGLTPLIGRLVRTRGRRVLGWSGLAVVVAGVVLAAVLWAPPRLPLSLWTKAKTPTEYARKVIDGIVSFGTWGVNAAGERAPRASDWYRSRAPAGPIVCLLVLAAVAFRPRRTWRWAILIGLFVVLQFAPLTPRNVTKSWCDLPVLSWLVRRRPLEPLNFYLFFLLTLVAGRALDVRVPLGCRRVWRVAAWAIVAANVLYVGWNTHTRLRYTVSKSLPAATWARYELLDRPSDEWRHHPCMLLRENIGLIDWSLDFRDERHAALAPSLVSTPDGGRRRNPDFRAMASFAEPENTARLDRFTPNRIVVHVTVHRPGVLVINQINDPDWRPSEGTRVRNAPLLAVDLKRTGEYDVRLRYVPSLLLIGLGFSVLAAVSGGALLAFLARRDRLRDAAPGR